MNEIVVTKTEHITHDLFLLMLNLSQVKNAQRMRELFMESMDYLFAGLHFSYVNDKPDRGGKAILISTLHNRFGYILIEGDLSGITADIVALISNAISMLAVVLENNKQHKQIADENQRLEEAVNKKTEQLLKKNAELLGYRAHLEELVAERTKDLKAANEELKAFSYSVSHDLRAPLRSINGFSHAIVEDYASKLDETGQDYLHRIADSAVRMDELIQDMLRLSKVSQSELQRVNLDLGDIAQQVVSELEEIKSNRKIKVQIQSPLEVNGDRTMVRVILDNLLGNAWKYTKNQENPVIEVGKIKKEGTDVYYVRDNGAGFDMRYKDKLFAPFQRLHSTSEFSGTGVGLATVQRIVHRHGGTIWAQGQIKEGATFYFTLTGKARIGAELKQVTEDHT